jgi:pyrrolysine biosynthesis protein PylC
VKARAFLAARLEGGDQEPLVFQEFVPGRSFSVEVIGVPGAYRTFPVTEIHVDDVHDCHLVTTPCALPPAVVDAFRRDAVKLAEEVSLHGIMDVETIYDEKAGVMKTLEIDARLPSQTPAAILASSGINLLEELARFLGSIRLRTGRNDAAGLQDADPSCPADTILPAAGLQDADPSCPADKILPAAYENILVRNGDVILAGEHIMGEAGPLRILPGFCGTDVTLTDYEPGMETFHCISIQREKTFSLLAEKRARSHQLLADLKKNRPDPFNACD